MLSPYGAHSDAQVFGRVAARALAPSDYTASTHLPLWFVEMAGAAEGGSPIYLFETAAARVRVSCVWVTRPLWLL